MAIQAWKLEHVSLDMQMTRMQNFLDPTYWFYNLPRSRRESYTNELTHTFSSNSANASYIKVGLPLQIMTMTSHPPVEPLIKMSQSPYIIPSRTGPILARSNGSNGPQNRVLEDNDILFLQYHLLKLLTVYLRVVFP